METAELRLQLERCHGQSYRWALHCCERDRGEAEDVLQTAYLKVLDGRARFDGRSSFSTWLFAVIRRTAADERRRRILRFVRHAPLRDDVPLVAEQPGAEDESKRTERRAKLEAALIALPRRQREVLLLVFYHERTVEEAAKVIGIGVGSARTHYARGKQRLRELLNESEIRHDT
jgi:RNA polymerase sigma-70 factor (ECF subfamily)